MEFRSNEDYYRRDNLFYVPGVSYNQAIDVLFSDLSSDTPAVEPVSEAECIQFAKIDSAMATADAANISIIAIAAREACEAYTNTSMVQRIVTAIINNGNGGAFLPYGPVGEIISVKNFEDTTLTSDEYRISGIKFKQLMWPRFDRITVEYEAGYETLPADFKLGLMQAFFYLWDNRSQGTTDIGIQARQTLKKYIRNV